MHTLKGGQMDDFNKSGTADLLRLLSDAGDGVFLFY